MRIIRYKASLLRGVAAAAARRLRCFVTKACLYVQLWDRNFACGVTLSVFIIGLEKIF